MASFFENVLNEVTKVLGLRSEPQLPAAEGHSMIPKPPRMPVPHDIRDMPLSGADLARAKAKLARKLDTGWEDR